MGDLVLAGAMSVLTKLVSSRGLVKVDFTCTGT